MHKVEKHMYYWLRTDKKKKKKVRIETPIKFPYASSNIREGLSMAQS